MTYQKAQQGNRRQTVRMCTQGPSDRIESLVPGTKFSAAPKTGCMSVSCQSQQGGTTVKI